MSGIRAVENFASVRSSGMRLRESNVGSYPHHRSPAGSGAKKSGTEIENLSIVAHISTEAREDICRATMVGPQDAVRKDGRTQDTIA
jgi:hypothetical protein